jgi:TetR/AcrR family transcriptional regulator, cholesterol catabolism regulator
MPADAGRDANRPRRRILDAALQLALQGGYDALQVRALSERAGVSSRTIYANFPSLDSLLILAVAEQSEGLYNRFTQSPPSGSNPAGRVNQLISELTETMTANRPLTVALLRALLSGKPDVSQYIKGFGDVLQAMLASAIAPEAPTTRDREVAELLENIWFTALVGWATGTTADDHISEIMQKATRLLLPDEKESLISGRLGNP